MTVTLSDLATEIVIKILGFLVEDAGQIGTLIGFAATCKRFHSIAEIIIYREIHVRFTNEDSAKRFNQLIRTLSNRPDLRAYVQEVYVHQLYPKNGYTGGCQKAIESAAQASAVRQGSQQMHGIMARAGMLSVGGRAVLEIKNFKNPLDDLFHLLPKLKCLKKFAWCSANRYGMYLQEHFLDAIKLLDPKCKVHIELHFEETNRLHDMAFVDSMKFHTFNAASLKHPLEIIRNCPRLRSLDLIYEEHAVWSPDLGDYHGSLLYSPPTRAEIERLRSVLKSVNFKNHSGLGAPYLSSTRRCWELPEDLKSIFNLSRIKSIRTSSAEMMGNFYVEKLPELENIEVWPEDLFGKQLAVDTEPTRKFLMNSHSIRSLKLVNVFGVLDDYEPLFEKIGPGLRELVISEHEDFMGICRRRVLSTAMIRFIGKHCPRLRHLGMDVNHKNEMPFFVFDTVAQAFPNIQELSFNFEIGLSRYTTPLRPTITETSAPTYWKYIWSKIIEFHHESTEANSSTLLEPALRILNFSTGIFTRGPTSRVTEQFSWNITERLSFRLLKSGFKDENGVYGCIVRCKEVERAKRRPTACANGDDTSSLKYALEKAKTGPIFNRWGQNIHCKRACESQAYYMYTIQQKFGPVTDGDNLHH